MVFQNIKRIFIGNKPIKAVNKGNNNLQKLLHLFGTVQEVVTDIFSRVDFNNWSNPDESGLVSRYSFYPVTDIIGKLQQFGTPDGLPVLDIQVIPDYMYYDPLNDYTLSYINTPSCPLTGWFVTLYTDTPALYTSAYNASPTFIPQEGWWSVEPDTTIPESISALNTQIVPSLFVGGVNVDSSFSDSDYVLDGLSFYRELDSNLDSITKIVGSFIDGPEGTRLLPLLMNFTHFKNLSSIEITDLPNLSSLTLPSNEKLRFFQLGLLPSLSSVDFNPNIIYKDIEEVLITTPINITEDNNFCDFIIKSLYASLSSFTTEQLQANNSYTKRFFYSTSLGGRTSASDDFFLKTFGSTAYTPIEIDGYYPQQELPTGTYYPHFLGDTITVQAPVSSNGVNYVRFNALSGIYTKTGDIKDNRDVFRNPNDYFVLFDEPNQRWTVVGPLSTSETIWLSAKETVGHYGSIPIRGWGGPAYKNGSTAHSSGNTGWWQDTSVFSTQMYVFSSLRHENGRFGYSALNGFNPDSYWKDLDFSGVGFLGNGDPWQPRFTLVSPVHFINTIHFPGTLSNGTTVQFIHKDGSISTRTVLSSVNIGTTNTTDVRIGILNAPVSAACYPIGSGFNFTIALTAKTDFKNFITGPTQIGTVCYGIPDAATNGRAYNIAPLNYDQIYSVPKFGWHSDNRFVAGDSSTNFWYNDNNQLITVGIVKYATPSSQIPLSDIYSSLVKEATALCDQFYNNPFMYQLTAYNF